jgi:transcriptional regulator with XRE-family HTH domain
MASSKRRTPAPAGDEIALLIRSRRSQLDWSLARLARASGLRSPAYVFHIENGTKMPREHVARRIAAALALDPELLAAWARARGRADLGSAIAASERLRAWMRETRAAPAESDEPPSGRAGPPDMLDVPLLPEGADPASGPIAARAVETLRLARELFPPLAADSVLVGYRLSAHGARRMPDVLRPGDCVVVRLGAEPPGPDAPCAVRNAGRVEIARVRVRDGVVYLPGPGGGHDSERSGVRIGPADGGTLVGGVVLAFRRWL